MSQSESSQADTLVSSQSSGGSTSSGSGGAPYAPLQQPLQIPYQAMYAPAYTAPMSLPQPSFDQFLAGLTQGLSQAVTTALAAKVATAAPTTSFPTQEWRKAVEALDDCISTSPASFAQLLKATLACVESPTSTSAAREYADIIHDIEATSASSSPFSVLDRRNKRTAEEPSERKSTRPTKKSRTSSEKRTPVEPCPGCPLCSVFTKNVSYCEADCPMRSTHTARSCFFLHPHLAADSDGWMENQAAAIARVSKAARAKYVPPPHNHTHTQPPTRPSLPTHHTQENTHVVPSTNSQTSAPSTNTPPHKGTQAVSHKEPANLTPPNQTTNAPTGLQTATTPLHPSHPEPSTAPKHSVNPTLENIKLRLITQALANLNENPILQRDKLLKKEHIKLTHITLQEAPQNRFPDTSFPLREPEPFEALGQAMREEGDLEQETKRKSMKCKYCQKSGHTLSFCPSLPNDNRTWGSKEEKEFAAHLINSPPVDTSIYNNTPIKELNKQIREQTTKLEQTHPNPWKVDPTESTSHVQRIQSHLSTWKAIGSRKNVMSWLTNGVYTRMITTPPKRKFRNEKPYYENIDFVHTEVLKHIKDGAFSIIPENEAHIINPIHVAVKDGKMRMCIDTRYPNRFLALPHFKNETIRSITSLFTEEKQPFFTSDISKAYYCIPLDPRVRKYFCFQHAGITLQPNILIFGLNEAPYFFNKIMREIVRFCRGNKILMAAYFDDLLWIEKILQQHTKDYELPNFVAQFMQELGWLLNEKTSLTPKLENKFIGWWINTKIMKLFVAEKKILNTLKILESMGESNKNKQQWKTSLTQLTSLAGRLSDMRPAIPAVPIWTSSIYKTIAKNTRDQDWSKRDIDVDDKTTEEIKFWVTNLARLNTGAPLRHPSTDTNITVTTDASRTGWGCHITEGLNRKTTGGTFPEYLQNKSSTHRELFAAKQALHEHAQQLKGKTVVLMLDSQATQHILQKGYSTQQDINDMLKELWTNTNKNTISLTVKWIPRENNKDADTLSRLMSAIPKEQRNEITKKVPHKVSFPETLKFSEEKSDTMPIIKPDVNHVAAAFAIAKLHKLSVGIIHPTWQAQIWWPLRFQPNYLRFDLTNQSLTIVSPSQDLQQFQT